MKKRFLAYLHTHWDLEWYRDEQDFNIRFLDVFDIVINELITNKAPFFYLDGQVIALLNYLKYRSENLDTILKLIKEKKLALGPYYVISDSYLTNFCCMLKNLELGLSEAEKFGQTDFIGYLSDIFGVSKSAFIALELNNINKAMLWRGVNPKLINNNCNFKYNNINTLWLTQGYFNDLFHNEAPDIKNIKKYLDKIAKYSSGISLLPIGGDHLGILKNATIKINEINNLLDEYEITLCNPFSYFEKTEFKNKPNCEEFLDNSDTYILQGVYSARIAQKIRNNKIQNLLTRIVEPLNFYLKDKYTKNIENIYKTLLKNHAHDGIYGCSLDSVHRTIDYRLDECENALFAILKKITGNFKEKYKIKGKSKNKIGLFNLSNCDNIKTISVKTPYIIPNSQIIKKERSFPDELLYDINKIPITENICPIYMQLIEISKNKKFEFNTVKIKKPEKRVKITEKSIENDFIKLEIKNKKPTITDKKTFKKISFKITDIKDYGDSYNFSPKGEYKTLELIKTKIIYEGEIQSLLRLYYKNIELDITLNNHAKFLEFNFKINNKTKNHKLELVFILNENINEIIAQDPIGTIKRKIDPNYSLKNAIPAPYPKELKTNSYPIQNFITAKNTTILTQGLHECTIYKNELKICLLRCFSTISNPKNKTRAIPAGPDLKTPDAQMHGINNAKVGILFGDEKEAFLSLDEFLENYIAIDGAYKNELNFAIDSIEANSYIYGISNNKKISYNLVNKKVSLL